MSLIPMTPLSARFDTALSFASRLHSGQFRNETSVPYIAHLLGVAGLALEYGATEDEAIAALLHDAVEDQGGAATAAVIARLFGEEVRRIVQGCTDSDEEPRPPWRTRKERYIVHLAHADASIRLVSCCDKLYNARAILRDYKLLGDSLFTRFSGGKDGVLWYYRALADTYLTQGPHAVAQELNATVAELESLCHKSISSGIA